MYEQDDLTEQLKNVENESDLVYNVIPVYMLRAMTQELLKHFDE